MGNHKIISHERDKPIYRRLDSHPFRLQSIIGYPRQRFDLLWNRQFLSHKNMEPIGDFAVDDLQRCNLYNCVFLNV